MTNKKFDSIEPIAELLPLKILHVNLNVLEPINMGMLHHIPLSGWLRNLVNGSDDFSKSLIIDPLENSHNAFEKGDCYQFRIIATPQGHQLLKKIAETLQSLPTSASHIPQTKLLHSNVSLKSLYDGISNQPYQSMQELTPLGLKAIYDVIMATKGSSSLTIKFLTPAILLKNEKSNEKGEKRYCRNQSDIDWSTLKNRISDTFITIIQNHTGIRYSRPEWPSCDISTGVTIWMQYRYHQKKQKNKSFGGVLTSIELTVNPDLEDWHYVLLYLGQYLGIGQSRGFGFGLYQIKEYPSLRNSQYNRLLNSAFSLNNIEKALEHHISKHGSYGYSFDELKTSMAKKVNQLLNSTYHFPPLTSCKIPKSDGGTRELNISPWQDRILQRAIGQTLSSNFESHWITESYGYRVGHSRYNARDIINNKIQQGYEWIVESDIKSFFDTVDWNNLFNRLSLLYPNDLEAIDIIRHWIQAPLKTTEGNIEQRVQGLPQGSPISPILANLILDDFDADMQALKYQIIRFADDFILLFHSEKEAKNSLPTIHSSLIEHGLELNLNKTRVSHYKQGFKFLGFYFIDGYAIETSNKDDQQEDPIQILPPESKIQDEIDTNLKIGDRENQGTVLIITGEISVLSAEHKKLKVVQDDKETHYCWHSLQCVVLIGPHQITTPTLRKAMRKNIPIYFVNSYGDYEGVSCSILPHNGAELWLQQMSLFQNCSWALTQSKNIVIARIDGIYNIIHRRDPKWHSLAKLNRLKNNIRNSKDKDQLRGYEGQAAKILWQFFHEILDPQWQFEGRNRRPPKDPVNTILSIGYTFLHNLCDSAIQISGLYAWQGFYHQSHGKHAALASDLIEPFRVIIERVTLTLINRLQLKPTDFAISSSGCEMSSEARKLLLNAIMAEITTKKGTDKKRHIDEIFAQPNQLIKSIRNNTNFNAWRPN